MNRGFPSMTALLGLLAVAGYQNRDKIAEMLGGIGKSAPEGSDQGALRRRMAGKVVAISLGDWRPVSAVPLSGAF